MKELLNLKRNARQAVQPKYDHIQHAAEVSVTIFREIQPEYDHIQHAAEVSMTIFRGNSA